MAVRRFSCFIRLYWQYVRSFVKVSVGMSFICLKSIAVGSSSDRHAEWHRFILIFIGIRGLSALCQTGAPMAKNAQADLALKILPTEIKLLTYEISRERLE